MLILFPSLLVWMFSMRFLLIIHSSYIWPIVIKRKLDPTPAPRSCSSRLTDCEVKSSNCFVS